MVTECANSLNTDGMSVKDDTYVFKVYKGKDRSYGQINYIPVVFSPEYDNLLSASYAFGTSEKKNSALIGGEGEGTDKVATSIGTVVDLEDLKHMWMALVYPVTVR